MTDKNAQATPKEEIEVPIDLDGATPSASDEVESFINETDIGDPPELGLEEQLEQLKGSNATLRIQLERREADLADLRDELSSEHEYATSMRRSYQEVSEARRREQDEFKNALELVALFFAGDTAPAKAVLKLEILAASSEPPTDMTHLRPIISRALSSAYEKAVNVSTKVAVRLQEQAEEAGAKKAADDIGTLLGKLFAGKGDERRSPLSDLFGADIPHEDDIGLDSSFDGLDSALMDELGRNCDDPSTCPVHRPGGIVEKLNHR